MIQIEQVFRALPFFHKMLYMVSSAPAVQPRKRTDGPLLIVLSVAYWKKRIEVVS